MNEKKLIYFTPNPNFVFSGWTVSFESQYNSTLNYNLKDANSITSYFTLTENAISGTIDAIILTAHFEEISTVNHDLLVDASRQIQSKHNELRTALENCGITYIYSDPTIMKMNADVSSLQSLIGAR